ncbi:MAG: HPF/RaiA family ribosome-associated protein, partial [Oscillospiraceae bacterium]|nr:HPF/RaiA family ribosome-associated protein [Oscillospiraceae bacterium]
MIFHIVEKKVQVSPEVRAYAEKKISKLDRFFRQESETSIVFSFERGRHIAEVTLNNNG